MPAFMIRDERPGDIASIRAVTRAAFETMPYSQQTEAAIVDALRSAGALAVSLVAVEGDTVIGHVAFSPVTIGSADAPGWYGIGPLSVRPDRQRSGVGSALMRAGIAHIRESGGQGCVVVGDPAYYERFGFVPGGSLSYPDLPGDFFRVLALGAGRPVGVVAFHTGFSARDD